MANKAEVETNYHSRVVPYLSPVAGDDRQLADELNKSR
jgi:hypothetical protein